MGRKKVEKEELWWSSLTVLLARLAVDERVAGRGVGRQLLVHALAGAAEASHHVGFDVVVVHAIDPRCHHDHEDRTSEFAL